MPFYEGCDSDCVDSTHQPSVDSEAHNHEYDPFDESWIEAMITI